MRTLAVTAGVGFFERPGRAGRPELPVHVVVPARVGPKTRLMIVLHGTDRNAAQYLAAWEPWASRNDRVILAPRFDRADWAGDYLLGGVLDTLGAARPRSHWAFTAVTELYRYATARFGLGEHRFDMWGHSAGAQFVHRYLLFCPEAPVRAAIAANAGWYTLPDLSVEFPYGLRHPGLGFGAAEVAAWVRQPLVLMRGAADVARDAHLRRTPLAEAQGPNRFVRAAAMHRAGHAATRWCRWRLVEVPGVGHDFVAMARAAQDLLAGSVSAGGAGCRPVTTTPLPIAAAAWDGG